MKIYCAHPISGRDFTEVFAYYDRTSRRLREIGYDVLTPMVAKDHLRAKGTASPTGCDFPLSTTQAIVGRDKWMVLESSIVYVNLIGVTEVSIGSMFELAWGYDHGKHTVVAMEDENPHRHVFVRGTAHVILPTEEETINYLDRLFWKDLNSE
jgi:hypothetical protein